MGPNPHQFDKWNNKVFINIKKYKIIHSWTPSPFIKEGGIEFSKLSQTKEEGGGGGGGGGQIFPINRKGLVK